MFIAVILLGEASWLVVGVVWFVKHYSTCHPVAAKKAVLGMYAQMSLYIVKT